LNIADLVHIFYYSVTIFTYKKAVSIDIFYTRMINPYLFLVYFNSLV